MPADRSSPSGAQPSDRTRSAWMPVPQPISRDGPPPGPGRSCSAASMLIGSPPGIPASGAAPCRKSCSYQSAIASYGAAVPDPAAPMPLDTATGRAVRSGLSIRQFTDADWPQVWAIFREVVTAADTYTYDPAMSEDAARGTWIEAAPALTVVVEDGAGRIVGTAKTGPNRPGPGAHIATASFMVAADA